MKKVDMQQAEVETVQPWYRQFWPWFLMALPASAVIAGITTVFIATANRDNLVVDNYYKQGLAINQTLTQQQYAQKINLSANVVLQIDSGKLQVQLSGTEQIIDPTLKLRIIHATLAAQDQTVILSKEKTNYYSGTVSNFTTGKWHVILEPMNAQWRIESNVSLPMQNWLLKPNV